MLSTRGRPSHIPPLPPSFTIHQRPPPSIEHRFLRISTSCPRPLIFASSSHRSSVCQFPHAIELCLFHSIYPRQVPPAKLTFPPSVLKRGRGSLGKRGPRSLSSPVLSSSSSSSSLPDNRPTTTLLVLLMRMMLESRAPRRTARQAILWMVWSCLEL